MLGEVLLWVVVRGRVMLAWAALRNLGVAGGVRNLEVGGGLRNLEVGGGLHNLVALARAGKVRTGLPGRTEAVRVLQSAAGGTAEERWWPLWCGWW